MTVAGPIDPNLCWHRLVTQTIMQLPIEIRLRYTFPRNEQRPIISLPPMKLKPLLTQRIRKIIDEFHLPSSFRFDQEIKIVCEGAGCKLLIDQINRD